MFIYRARNETVEEDCHSQDCCNVENSGLLFRIRYDIIANKHREDPMECCDGLFRDWLTTCKPWGDTKDMDYTIEKS